jgi:hypothetical protein
MSSRSCVLPPFSLFVSLVWWYAELGVVKSAGEAEALVFTVSPKSHPTVKRGMSCVALPVVVLCVLPGFWTGGGVEGCLQLLMRFC